MATKTRYSNCSNEELIVMYAQHFYDETKKAQRQEQSILKELAIRNIIDKNAMNELYKKKALCPVL